MKCFAVLLFLFLSLLTTAQSTGTGSGFITAFPSLNIPTGSRSFAMGDCGIASATDNDQLFYNPAKLAFTQNFHQGQVSYTPWLTGVSIDTRFMSASYAATLNNTSALAFSIGYLNYGSIDTRDNNGALLGLYANSEYNIATQYALQLTRNASLGIGFKFLSTQSPKLIDQYNNVIPGKSISGVAGDLSYYQFLELERYGSKLEWGAALKNFGPAKQQGNSLLYLPTNFGIGLSYTHADATTGDRFTATLDLNKYGIPSPGGKSPTASIFQSLYGSFSDASQGFSEELQEIRINAGLEYGFVNQFFLRGGIAYETKSKGNRQYFGLGSGYRGNLMDQTFAIDIHYLVPFGYVGMSPFQNCYGFSLKLGIGNFE